MLAACHIVRVMGLDFLLLVLPCTGFLYLQYNTVQYDMLPTYLKNNYRLKATLLGTNSLPDDGFI